MDWILNLLSTIGIFAGALMILVFIHELGHFLAAKFFGMKVDRFSVGFPPRVWGFERGGTDYCIGATPLGGYVKIAGMVDESMDTEQLSQEPQPWEYRSKPIWQRMVVILAGVVFNMILAAIIFFGITYTQGRMVVPIDAISGIYVPDNSLPYEIGFRTGDRITAINGKKAQYFNDLFATDELTSSKLSYTVVRDGNEQILDVDLSILDRIQKEGFLGIENILPSIPSAILSGSPAEKAGLKAGDRLIAADGVPIQHWLALVKSIHESGDVINFTVNRDGSIFEIAVEPNPETKTIGIAPPSDLSIVGAERISYGFFASIAQGIDETKVVTLTTVQGFARMFSGDISVRENLGGAIQIANVTKQATDSNGWIGFWNITALLSVTLAFINILPIPALDGGHFMFCFLK